MSLVSRRRFLQLSATGIAASASMGAIVACAKQRDAALGIQLYTLRDAMAEDVGRVLAALARIGYREVEFAGYFDHKAADLSEMLRANSLSAPAAHIPYETMQADLEPTIEFSQILGHNYLVVPWLREEQRQTIDDYLRHAERLNAWGERCRAAGIQLCYHNHAFEFSTIDDRVPYDILLQNTDPSLVAMEIDLYWINKAGFSAFSYFARYPVRFPLWHLKDIAADGSMTDVGDGEIDFSAHLAQREQAGLQHGFVEHDDSNDPMLTAERSFQFLFDRW